MHSETIDTGVVWVAMVIGDVESHITECFLVVLFLYKTQYRTIQHIQSVSTTHNIKRLNGRQFTIILEGAQLTTLIT